MRNFPHWLAPYYIQALPQLLLPMYSSIRGSLYHNKPSPFHKPSLWHAVRSPQLMPTTRVCKIIFVQFGLCENYFMRIFLDKNLLDETKANYGNVYEWSTVMTQITHHI